MELEVRTGLACQIILLAAESTPRPQRATIEISDAAGRPVTTVTAYRMEGELRSTLKLTPGAYSLQATAPDGRAGSGQLLVTASSPETTIARILLR